MSRARWRTTWSADCPSSEGETGVFWAAIGLTNSLHGRRIVNKMIDQFSKHRLAFASLATLHDLLAGDWSDLFGNGIPKSGHPRRLFRSRRHPRRQRLLPRRLELRLRAGAADPAVARPRQLAAGRLRGAPPRQELVGPV